MSPAKGKKVLVVNNPRFFGRFHENLCRTLSELGLSVVEAKTASTAEEMLLSKKSDRFLLLCLDPMAEGFRSTTWQDGLESLAPSRRPNVVTIVLDPNDEFDELNDMLNVSGKIAKCQDPHDFAFVFNRILFTKESNRRKSPRVLSSLGAVYSLDDRDGEACESTFNLSLGGAFVRTLNPEPEGKVIQLSLELAEDGNPLQCRGEVVHSRPHALGSANLHPSGMGVRFEPLSAEDRVRLQAHLEPRLLRVDRHR